MDSNSLASWVDLPYITLCRMQALYDAERKLYTGERVEFERDGEVLERSLRTSYAAVRLAMAPAAWLPPKLDRDESAFPTGTDVVKPMRGKHTSIRQGAFIQVYLDPVSIIRTGCSR